MNADSVKRLVALSRQAAGYQSMVRRGTLLQSEADLLIAGINSEIAAIRAQSELSVGSDKKPK